MKDKLRVAMFISSYPSTGGGVQEHIYYLSDELRKLGVDVSIFGPHSAHVRYRNYTPIGYVTQLPTLNGSSGYIHFLKQGLDLNRIFSPKKFDLLHIHEPYAPFASWNLIQNVSLPKLTTFHNAWDNTSIHNILSAIIPFFQGIFSQNVQAAIFVSRISQKRWSVICSSKTIQKVINNGIDLDIFHPLKKKPQHHSPRILFVGRIVQSKGVRYLLKASASVIKAVPEVQIQIMGKGPELLWCESFVKSHKLQKNVKILGEILGEKKIAYYQNADIFCAPYSDEANPITVLEALACGCTIVGFESEALKEELRDYPYQNLIVEKDVKKLSEALIWALHHKKERDKISQWTQKEIKKYSWPTIATQILDAYREIARI